MKIAQKYSHLNGEEYLIVHHPNLYDEIKDAIESIDAEQLRTKVSKEIRKGGANLYSPIDLNKAFQHEFAKRDWVESRYNYYITLNRGLMEKSVLLPANEQKKFLIENGEKEPIYSYNQTDFVKSMLGIFLLGPKQVFFRLFSPFFGYIVTAMLPQKRKNSRKNPLFLAPAENPQHALKTKSLSKSSSGNTHLSPTTCL